MKPLIEFAHVGFAYGERNVLRDIDASVFEKQCIAVVGPNGAGKTTLLRLAAGTLAPARGEVYLKRRDLRSLKQREIARSVAFVPQNVEVPFSFTVEQLVEQGRTPFLGLAQQPQLLLLDEPMQHLDIGRQFEMIDLIGSLRREGIAIVASMHDLALIEGTFSSVWLMSPGEPMQQGSPEEILRPEVLEFAFNCQPHHRPKLLERMHNRKEFAS